MKETIGWIGIGSMGHRMSKHLAKAGYPLVMADAVSTKLAPPGATIAKSNAEVAEKADVIILSLPDGSVSEAVAREIASAKTRRVKTVIDTSTIGIKAAEAVAAVLEKADLQFVDAPVSGGTSGADKATIAIMVACPAGAYERFKPLLALMGKPFHVGPKPGQGQAVKILNNYLSATALAATCEAALFGVQQGLDLAQIVDVINVSSGRSTASSDKFPRSILPRSYDFGFAGAHMTKDVRLYLEAVEGVETPRALAAAVVGLWQRFHEAHPDADFTYIYQYLEDGGG
jgi:3-hydroxyisobutyrate dehydrogenase